MANNFEGGSAGDRFRSAAEARAAFLTNTTQITSPETAEAYAGIYEVATKLGGIDMRTVVLPYVAPDFWHSLPDNQQHDLRRFMGSATLETAPYGIHMTYAQRQQLIADKTMLRSLSRSNHRVRIGRKTGMLAVAALPGESMTDGSHYSTMMRMLGSEWGGSWKSADGLAIAYNAAAVRSLRSVLGDKPVATDITRHKHVGDIVEVLSAKDALSMRHRSATTLISALEYDWLIAAQKASGMKASVLLGVAAEYYGSSMQLRRTPNWMRLHALDDKPAAQQAQEQSPMAVLPAGELNDAGLAA